MYTGPFASVFSEFLDGHTYDTAENALFDRMHTAFAAGWQAAGGTPPGPGRTQESSPSSSDGDQGCQAP